MASHTEVALVNANGRAKTRKARTGRLGGASEKAKSTSSRKTHEAAKRQTSGTDIMPVMKLRAIDIVDDDKPKTGSGKKAEAAEEQSVIHMPQPKSADTDDAQAASLQNEGNGDASNGAPESAIDESVVSDPELLELLEQLSATIDTANTVLDAASTVPAEESGALAELANNGAQEAEPKPSPAPQPEPVPEDEDLPPIAAQLANHDKNNNADKKSGAGFGLVVNTALTGLVFAAGVAWLLHTNPRLIDSTLKGNGKADPEVTAISPAEAVKDQSSLAATDASPQSEAAPASDAKPSDASLASFTPPEEEPVPMETIQPAAPLTVADTKEPASGPAGQSINLGITLPKNVSGPEVSVMVQGVPEQAKLSDGKDLGSGNWLLNAEQMKDLKLVTQKTLEPRAYTLEVILVQSDGSVPETRKVEVSVEPAAAANTQTPVASAPAGIKFVKNGVADDSTGAAVNSVEPASEPEPVAGPPLTPQELRALLSRGERLLQEGDVAGARLLLEYAAQRGSKDAMVILAKSYDPEHLAKLGVHGVQANPEQATRWYARAAETTAQ